jgi:molecular chaperone HscB
MSAPESERQQAVGMTALLNDAYRTLRNPSRRVEYLLSLSGFKPDGSKVPQKLLMEVFEINEQLEEVKAGRATADQLRDLHRQIREKGEKFEREIEAASAEWDRLVLSGATEEQLRRHLGKLTEIVSESSYVRNLERELDQR